MRAAIAAFLAACAWPAAHAGDLADGYRRALAADPAYQSAKAEYEVNRIAASRAGRAYLPGFNFLSGERSEIRGSQTTVQVTQPVLDADRFATARSADPLEARALATMRQRDAELLQRYFKAVSDLVRAREQLALNQAKSEALARQSEAARSAFKLGTGTRTDVYDTEVRLSLARAEQLTLRANLASARRQFQVLTGTVPPQGGFPLARDMRPLALPALSGVLERAEQANPQVVVAQQGERLADLDVSRRQGAFLPRVNAVAKQTRTGEGLNSSYIGLRFELPFDSGTLLDVSGARASLAKANEDVRVAKSGARLEAQRLHELVTAGEQELAIRREVIQAARLSLEASEKSFQGGVRTQIDVLNSIQTLYQTQDDYVAAALNVGSLFVSLHATVDTPSADVLEALERFLF